MSGRGCLPMLAYHSVEDSERDRFRLQMGLLSRLGYRTITFAQLVSLIRQGGTLPAKTVVLTFDDGTADHHRNVLPIFRQFGLVGTFFVSPGLTGTERWMIKRTTARSREMFDYEPRPAPSGADNLCSSHFVHLTWDQVVDLRLAGQEIGSHGMTHPFLTGIPVVEAEHEIRVSKELIGARLGQQVQTFCYPFGDHTSVIQEIVRAAGYQGACVTAPTSDSEVRFDDIFALGRFPANVQMPVWAFLLVISGGDFLRRRLAGRPMTAPVLRAVRSARSAVRRVRRHA